MAASSASPPPRLLRPPLTDADVDPLRAGDEVLFTGRVYAARDAAHMRLQELAEAGEPWPFPAEGAVLYYVGPTPERPGKPIGSAGPTTASRMDALTPMMLERGVKAIIGKGKRRAESLRHEFVAHHAVYCAAVGGAGAVAAQRIVEAEIVAFPDLGPEAIRAIDVEDFPALVVNDVTGADYYEVAPVAWRR